MSCSTLTESFEAPAQNYILEKWVDSKRTNAFKKHILARGGFLGLTPFSATACVLDTIIGVGAGLASIVTVGKHEPTFKFAKNYLKCSRTIIALPYVNLLLTLNPKAKFSNSEDQLISLNGDGFITSFVSKKLKSIAKSCNKSDNFIKHHICSRLTYLLLAISSIITRVVDGIIGAGAGILSFLTFGKVASINSLAYRGLQTPGIVKDLFYCTVKFINPHAGTWRN